MFPPRKIPSNAIWPMTELKHITRIKGKRAPVLWTKAPEYGLTTEARGLFRARLLVAAEGICSCLNVCECNRKLLGPKSRLSLLREQRGEAGSWKNQSG